jgi:hypothetical protein
MRKCSPKRSHDKSRFWSGLAGQGHYLARRQARTPSPRVTIETERDGGVRIGPDHPDRRLWTIALEQAFGTVNAPFATLMMSLVSGVVLTDDNTLDPQALNGMLAALHGINPQDEVEGMLAVQMVSTHLAAMGCLRRAQFAEQTFHGRDMNLRHAAKLSRTYTMQVESLKRYRSKGEQRVVVQHQHVNVTAEQAAVQVNGGVDPAPEGRGAASKPEEQPHAPAKPAPLAYEPGTPLPCPDPAGDAVPVAGGEGTEAVPHARRR